MDRFLNIAAKQTDPVEIELRYKNSNKDLIYAVYDKLSADSSIKNTIEFSINIINKSANYESHIRSKIFCVDGSVDKYYIKRNIAYENIGAYKLNAAIEKPIDAFKMESNPLARIKARVSWFIDSWRVDLTFVLSGEFKSFNLANIKEKLFKCNASLSQLRGILESQNFTSYEIECEYIPGASKLPSKADIDNIMTKLNGYFNDKSGEILYIAELLDVRGYAGSLGNFSSVRNKAMSLTKSMYMEIFPPIGWYVTEKSDGVRCFILMEAQRLLVITDNIKEYKLSEPAPFRVLCDAEFINDTAHIFDCMIYENPVFNQGFKTRLEYLEKCADALNGRVPEVKTVAKKFAKITNENLKTVFAEVYKAKRAHAIDGLIIVSADDSYRKTKNYKWKSHEHNTIDFLAFKYPGPFRDVMSAKPDHDLYILMTGINHEKRIKMGIKLIQQYDQMVSTKFPNLNSAEYYPVQFTPSINPRAYMYYHPKKDGDINGKVVEMRCDDCRSMVSKWALVRVREDRKMERLDFGNDYKIAEITYNNYLDPLTFEELSNPRGGYFEKVADNIYKSSNGYKRFVITQALEKHFRDAEYIIDEASGRGGDLMRYYNIGVKNLLCMDIDPSAITELIIRKNSGVEKQYGKNANTRINTRVLALIEDLKTPYKTMINNFNYYGFAEGAINGIICNFALHYLCKTQANLHNVLKLNSEMLKVGGLFMFTTMNGAKIFDLLSSVDVGERWEVFEGDQIKYAIRRDYKGDTLQNVGQMISILLPMSNGKLYEEPLANIEYIIESAREFDLELVEEYPFSRMLGEYDGDLSDDDKFYIGLHHVVILRRVEKKKVGGRTRRVKK